MTPPLVMSLRSRAEGLFISCLNCETAPFRHNQVSVYWYDCTKKGFSLSKYFCTIFHVYLGDCRHSAFLSLRYWWLKRDWIQTPPSPPFPPAPAIGVCVWHIAGAHEHNSQQCSASRWRKHSCTETGMENPSWYKTETSELDTQEGAVGRNGVSNRDRKPLQQGPIQISQRKRWFLCFVLFLLIILFVMWPCHLANVPLEIVNTYAFGDYPMRLEHDWTHVRADKQLLGVSAECCALKTARHRASWSEPTDRLFPL